MTVKTINQHYESLTAYKAQLYQGAYTMSSNVKKHIQCSGKVGMEVWVGGKCFLDGGCSGNIWADGGGLED